MRTKAKERAVKLHKKGLTIRECAKKLRVAHSTVWNWLQDQEVNTRQRRRYKPQRALELEAQGLSKRKIAKKMGCTERYVYKLIKEGRSTP